MDEYISRMRIQFQFSIFSIKFADKRNKREKGREKENGDQKENNAIQISK